VYQRVVADSRLPGSVLVAGPLPGSIGEQRGCHGLVGPAIRFGTNGNGFCRDGQAGGSRGVETAKRNLLQAAEFRVDRIEIVGCRGQRDCTVHESGLTGRLAELTRFVEHQPFERSIVLGNRGREQRLRGEPRSGGSASVGERFTETPLQLSAAPGQIPWRRWPVEPAVRGELLHGGPKAGRVRGGRIFDSVFGGA